MEIGPNKFPKAKLILLVTILISGQRSITINTNIFSELLDKDSGRRHYSLCYLDLKLNTDFLLNCFYFKI
jgi:hypothetical protein